MFQPLSGLVAKEAEREIARRLAAAGRTRLAAARATACRESTAAGAGGGPKPVSIPRRTPARPAAA
jgi:hypothetical protein